MNIVALMGRLTAEPEIRKTQNDISVCSFSIAVDRFSNGENHADFINCVAFKNTADNIAKFFRKGQLIGISGSIQTSTYQDKETGKNRTSFKVIVDRFYFAQNNNQNNVRSAQQFFAQPQFIQQTEAAQQNFSNGFQYVNDDYGDLPF